MRLIGSSRKAPPMILRKNTVLKSQLGRFKSKTTVIDLQISVKPLHQTELSGKLSSILENDENQYLKINGEAHRAGFSGDRS